MRLALVAPVALPVPPAGYGGTERVVAWLADGLAARGHDVTLFASAGSRTGARLAEPAPEAFGAVPDAEAREAYEAYEAAHVARALEAAWAGAFDLVHDHTKASGLRAAASGSPVPWITTVHNDLTDARRALYGAYPDHRYVAISRAHAERLEGLNVVGSVHNGLDPAEIGELPARKKDYLLFLGRLDEAKGAHLAARAAAEHGWELVLAGRVGPLERAFFEAEVAPWLDGKRRRYVGEVNGAAKWRLYAEARALLFPIQWPEPFGLVVIEAMAAGTPVVATRWGSVPELVEPGLTGSIVSPEGDPASLAAGLASALALDPAAVAARARQRFEAARMVEAYEALYARVLAGSGALRA